MKIRTIQPAAGHSGVTPEQARAAARRVYRDRKTGGFLIEEPDGSLRAVSKSAFARIPSVHIVQNRSRPKQAKSKRGSAKKR